MEKNTNTLPIKDFKDLQVWQESHRLAVMVYEITKKFPNDELYGLSSQMRRAAVSVAANIAEGFGRRHIKEKQQFYAIAKGSLVELQSELLIARDVSFLNIEDFEKIYTNSESAHRLLNAFTSKLYTQ